MSTFFDWRQHAVHLWLTGALVCLVASAARAQQPGAALGAPKDPVLEMEFKFAEELIKASMPDYAQIVIDRIAPTPENRIRIEVLKVQGMIALGEFDKVRQIIAQRPDQTSPETWALRLALADGHFAWGQFKEARSLYTQFFKAYPDKPPEALNDFFRDSAYKFAQMLLLIGEEEEAIKAYQTVLKAELDDNVKRQIVAETAELMLKLAEPLPPAERKRRIPEIEKLLDSILYGGVDLWFGKAMAMTAHLRLLADDVEGAMFIIESNWDQLVELDGILRAHDEEHGGNFIRFSPLAHVRYMLADIQLAEARKIKPWPPTGQDRVRAFELLAESRDERGRRRDGAFRHYLNVFYQYSASQWAPEAGRKAEEVKRLIEEDIKPAKFEVRIDPERVAEVERAQFQEARVLFNQQQFAQAAEAYIRVLNIFPETETSVAALGELALCYIEIPLVSKVDDAGSEEYERNVQMLAGYMSERFNKNAELSTPAGDRVLRVAAKYEELGRRARRNQIQDIFFAHFPEHPRTPGLLYTVAQERFEAKDLDGALGYFTQIATNYPGNRVYFPALNRMAQIYHTQDEYLLEMETLDKLVDELGKETSPGHLYVGAQYRLAHAHRARGVQLIRSAREPVEEEPASDPAPIVADEPESAEPPADPLAEGETHVRNAIQRYTQLRDLLSGDQVGLYQSTADETENNRRMMEGCLFYIGYCHSLLTSDPDEAEKNRRHALTMYENLLKRYPKSPFAPAAYSQIGTLWTILQEPERAREALDRLRKEHPESPEARLALYQLGVNLLELGMRAEAAKVFAEMFRGGTEYTPVQIMTAGTELNRAGEHEIALQAFDRIAGDVKPGTGMHERALLGRGEALLGVGRFDDARQSLETLVEQYPKSRNVLPASTLLAKAYAELAMRERDASKRLNMFNEAVKRLNHVRRFDKTRVDRARSNLAVANIFSLRVKAEEKFGTPESVKENIPRAIVPLLTMIIGAQYDNLEELPYIEEAYYRIVPLYIQDERWLDARTHAEDYIKHFPRGRYLSEIRQWRGQAETRMVMLGISREEEAVEMMDVPPYEDLDGDMDDDLGDLPTEPAPADAPDEENKEEGPHEENDTE